ncbi:MAG: hypothetical protein LBO82_00240, partial [Synergistaceae bacterium]|nr:hypothetical protein [Synergistaceae bacterium]
MTLRTGKTVCNRFGFRNEEGEELAGAEMRAIFLNLREQPEVRRSAEGDNRREGGDTDGMRSSDKRRSGRDDFTATNCLISCFGGPGDLRIEGNNGVRVKAPTVTADGNLRVTGTSDLNGTVTMHNNLDMSN